MTRRQLSMACRRWQTRLGLMEWTITAEFVPLARLQKGVDPGRHYYGESDVDLALHRAVIRICQPKEMAMFDPGLPIEWTLLHEMGHILLDPTCRIADDALFELGLDRMAAALIRAYAKKNP
jgi:hypothetical protein